jgi:8-oxo-dGTP diphosphatase
MPGIDYFFKSAFSVDNIIFGFGDKGLKVLLIKRGTDPFKDLWALPGDLVYPDEDLDQAAARVLEQLTSLKGVFLEQVKAFGTVNRHPLGRVITVAYYSLIKIDRYKIAPSSFASQLEWHNVGDVNGLAFDHDIIFKDCFERLKQVVRTRPVGFELLPEKFTLTELQLLYESILEKEFDKRNFRKKILSMDLLVDLDLYQSKVAHRPAKLYKFESEKYQRLVQAGFNFDL